MAAFDYLSILFGFLFNLFSFIIIIICNLILDIKLEGWNPKMVAESSQKFWNSNNPEIQLWNSTKRKHNYHIVFFFNDLTQNLQKLWPLHKTWFRTRGKTIWSRYCRWSSLFKKCFSQKDRIHNSPAPKNKARPFIDRNSSPCKTQRTIHSFAHFTARYFSVSFKKIKHIFK